MIPFLPSVMDMWFLKIGKIENRFPFFRIIKSEESSCW